jgi:hypothetical protein
MRDVTVNEQHRVVVFHGHADGQVDGSERLAFAGQRAGHEHKVPVPDCAVNGVSVLQDRTLQNPEFIGYLRLRRVGCDKTKLFSARRVPRAPWAWPRSTWRTAVRQLRRR